MLEQDLNNTTSVPTAWPVTGINIITANGKMWYKMTTKKPRKFSDDHTKHSRIINIVPRFSPLCPHPSPLVVMRRQGRQRRDRAWERGWCIRGVWSGHNKSYGAAWWSRDWITKKCRTRGLAGEGNNFVKSKDRFVFVLINALWLVLRKM